MADLLEIGRLLRTQDNRCTADPVFCVQERRRLYGFDTCYTEDVAFIDDCNDYAELTGEELEAAKAHYEEHLESPQDITRTGYVDNWEFVAAFFTNDAAVTFIESNKHRLSFPRVYVASGYRNYEWQAVRKSLMDQAIPAVEAPL